MSHEGCICGDMWRFDACELKTGRVKAVLHPISIDWEEPFSKPGQGSLMVATRQYAAEEIWSDLTSIYISRVIPGNQNQREGFWAGIVDQYGGSSGGATTIGMRSIESYLYDRLLAGNDDGQSYNVDDRPQTLVAQDLVGYAGWNGIPLTATAEVSTQERERNWNPWELKNVGEAVIDELCNNTINGPKYRMAHDFVTGFWSSRMIFSDDNPVDRNIVLKSDVEGWEYAITVDAKDHVTRCYAIGAGDEASQILAVAYDESGLYPEFHKAPAWKDVSIQETLNEYSMGEVANHRDPLTTPSMTILGLGSDDENDPAPKPEDLQVGDRVKVEIAYGLVSFNGYCRVLSIAYGIAPDSAIKRVVTFQPEVRPALSVRLEPPINRPPPGDPNAEGGALSQDPGEGDPEPGLVSNLTDTNIGESSGLAYSKGWNDVAYTHNDEDGPVYAVQVSTGATVGTFTYGGVGSLKDPEAIALDVLTNELYLADIGDNDNNRSSRALVVLVEPGPGNHGTLAATKYPLSYPFSAKNAECFAIHPKDGIKYLLTKESGNGGRLVSYPAGALSTGGNMGTLVASGLMPNASDMCFTNDGRFLLVKSSLSTNVWVYETSGWTKVGEIEGPSLPKGESITMEPGGVSFLLGSEGERAPLWRVLLPTDFRPSTSAGIRPSNIPGDLIDLSKWKLTLPVGKPDEIKNPALLQYEDSNFFDEAGAVVFRCRVDGAHTSGSSYPRCELREMNGGSLAAWNSGSGTHVMTIDQSIDYTMTAKPHVVAGQIHDADDDLVVLRLEGSTLYATNRDNTHYGVLWQGYERGTRFTVTFTATSSGVLVAIDGHGSVNVPVTSSGCYFKAGVYPQSNPSKGDSGDKYGEVRIYGLEISHS